jgi:prepilin-type N-terminal cleavage/methylation domain-containing protein
MQIKRNTKGFTLLEILLVIAAIGILAAIVLVAINPNRQLAQARDTSRQSDINTLQKALDQYLIDTGAYPTSVSATPGYICNTGTEVVGGATNCSGRIDLRILVPTYIAAIPRDTQAIGTSTGYNVVINPNNNKVGVSADLAERKLISINPHIITSGLLVNLDAGNTASYPGSGTIWTDLSGNGNNATLIGGISFLNNAFTIDAQGEGIGVNFASQTKWTISLWFRKNANGSGLARIAGSGPFWDRGEVAFVADNISVNGPRNASWRPTATGVLNGETAHISVCFDTEVTSNNVFVYKNGNLTYSVADTAGVETPTNQYMLGARSDLNTEWLPSTIYGVQLYSRCLTPEEIQQNFNAMRGRYGI